MESRNLVEAGRPRTDIPPVARMRMGINKSARLKPWRALAKVALVWPNTSPGSGDVVLNPF